MERKELCRRIRGDGIMMQPWEKHVYEFAKKAHEGQKYSDNEDYFETHILSVVALVKQVTNSTTMITTAYLHDVIEDTDISYRDLQEHFAYPIPEWVLELTKERRNNFPRLKTKECIIIKFADRLSNLSRMEIWDDDRQRRYLDKSRFWEM